MPSVVKNFVLSTHHHDLKRVHGDDLLAKL